MALERVRASIGEAAARLRRHPRATEHLTDRELNRLRERIAACLDPRVSGVTVRSRAGEVASMVQSLDRAGLLRFFTLLLDEFGLDHEVLRVALSNATAALNAPSTGPFAPDPTGWKATQWEEMARLRRAGTARWEYLFELLCGLEGGVKLAVDLRAELLALLPTEAHLAPLDADMHRVLSRLFPPGLLELRRITWDSQASLLEKLIEYESVHEITGWSDLKNRLDDHDRRCYAFIHPGMPDEPLIFVEVALLKDMAADVVSLLDVGAPIGASEQARTANFYSISACQPGLSGVNLGDVLIKEVVADLTRDLPRLNQFATLSPIPGFRRWLETSLQDPNWSLLTPEDCRAIADVSTNGAGTPADLAALLAGPWTADSVTSRVLREVLVGLCCDYLVGEGIGRSRDRVANFHLTNGAQIERLNWLANPTPSGMRESYGLMVNYRYDLPRIDSNHELYGAEGQIARSSAIARILTARRKGRAARPDTS